nr:MAG TPA: hypothetical protein [Caudoviricetes sp.]
MEQHDRLLQPLFCILQAKTLCCVGRAFLRKGIANEEAEWIRHEIFLMISVKYDSITLCFITACAAIFGV